MLARRTLAAAAAAALTLALAASADARTRLANEWRPIVYVHGWEQDGGADCEQWKDLHDHLQAWGGFQQTKATVGYYADDANCTYWSHHHGNHTAQRGDTAGTHQQAAASTETGHTTDAPIEHLAHHFAWTVYDHFSKGGRPVDVVAHSMGGLIARYAMEKVERGNDPDFPPYMTIDDVVTLGTPHDGSKLSAFTHDQGQQMYDSAFLDWVREYAQDPQPHPTVRADWTNVGTEDDFLVEDESATAMGPAANKVRYEGDRGLAHSDYHKRFSETWDFDVDWWSEQERWWHTWTAAPPPSGWTYFALCCANR